MADPVEILDFWLGEIGPEGWFAGAFAGGEDIDAVISARFAEVLDALAAGHLEHWVDGAAGTLAYLIVADQFSRNIHRGKGCAFATDARALSAARVALEAGWDMNAPEPERQFFYMPFEHSEDLTDQDLAVNLMVERMPGSPDMGLHARAHREVIVRFGRFPFRNDALGRESTPEEAAFLEAGGYGAVVRALSHAPGA